MSIFDTSHMERIDREEDERTTDTGTARPLTRDELRMAPCDTTYGRMLAEQNTVLFWAYELADVALLRRRDARLARYRRHVRIMRDALYLGNDRGFYDRLFEAKVEFWVRYAWLFAMLCLRTDDDLALYGPVDVGLNDGYHNERGTGVRYGLARDKFEFVEVRLWDVPLVMADAPSDSVDATERLVARYEEPQLPIDQRMANLDAALARRVGRNASGASGDTRKRPRADAG